MVNLVIALCFFVDDGAPDGLQIFGLELGAVLLDELMNRLYMVDVLFMLQNTQITKLPETAFLGAKKFYRQIRVLRTVDRLFREQNFFGRTQLLRLGSFSL